MSELGATECEFLDQRSISASKRVVPPFLASIFPVTRREFLTWIAERGSFLNETSTQFWRKFDKEYDYHDDAPIVGATPEEALAYAFSLDARLPYYEECIRMARGEGDEDALTDDGRLKYASRDENSTELHRFLTPVTENPGVSWCGVRDLLGNTDEMTLSVGVMSANRARRSEDPAWDAFQAVMRYGIGTPFFDAGLATCISRTSVWRIRDHYETFRPLITGFRLVWDPPY